MGLIRASLVLDFRNGTKLHNTAKGEGLSDPVELWSSKRHLSVLFSPPPAPCRFGRQALYFWRRSFGVAVQIRKWHPSFPAYSEMRVCQRHLCVLISC